MRYTGLRFKKIEAEKMEDSTGGNINVNSHFNLGKVKKEEDFTKDSEKPIFSFEFVYDIEYEKVAKISFKGTIYIEIEEKSIIKELEEDNPKITDNTLRKFILDIVLARAHVESLHLEEKLNLPFHIQSPRVSIGEKENQ